MDDWITRQGNGVAAILLIIFMVIGGSVFHYDGVVLVFFSAILALSIAGVMEAVMRINRSIFGGNRTEVHIHHTETVYVEKTVYGERPVDEYPARLTPHREVLTPRYRNYPEIDGAEHGIETERLARRGRNPRLR